jgi:hypothetical protein
VLKGMSWFLYPFVQLRIVQPLYKRAFILIRRSDNRNRCYRSADRSSNRRQSRVFAIYD